MSLGRAQRSAAYGGNLLEAQNLQGLVLKLRNKIAPRLFLSCTFWNQLLPTSRQLICKNFCVLCVEFVSFDRYWP